MTNKELYEPILSNDGGHVGFRVHSRGMPNFEARIAEELIVRWGLIAATTNGEDSAGRQTKRLCRPYELVERACETAELFAKEVRARGWMVPLPSLRDALAEREGDLKEHSRLVSDIDKLRKMMSDKV